jgi:outer membrane protein assembly factor BamB
VYNSDVKSFYRNVILAVALTSARDALVADDWPQWRGPQRNGQSAERDVLAAWPEGMPTKIIWRAQVGKGHSSVAVIGKRAYTIGWNGTHETVWCFDALTGGEIWRKSYPSTTIFQWPGPRATPTVKDRVVFTLGQHGQLRAWNAADGELHWKHDLATSYQPDKDYGFPWSPLIEGDLLLLGAGSRGLAVSIKGGTPVWGADEKPGACASPVPFMHMGKQGVALVTMNENRDAASLVGLDVRTGTPLWQYGPWPEKWGAICNDLLVADDSVFVTSAEQHLRGARLRIAGKTLEPVWESPKAASYTGNAVLVDDHLYLVTKAGILSCLDWATGKVRWTQRGFGTYGALIAADGKLFVTASDTGELAVVKSDPARYHELRRMQPFEGNGETFTAPTLAHGRLYCRTYAGDVVCLQIGPD